MEKRIIKIETSWTDDNYCAAAFLPDIEGVVMDTGKTFEDLKRSFEETLRSHIEMCLEAGDKIPEYLKEGNYELEFVFDVSAILKESEKFTTLAAISEVTGINRKQLSHYLRGEKKPRPDKRIKIIEGLHHIGEMALSIH